MTPCDGRVTVREMVSRSAAGVSERRHRRIDPQWLRTDGLPLLVFAVISVVLEWDRLTGPAWIGMDTATAFYPWYTFLGDQLRAGHIPVWNPYQFAGAPFAADPESGWMYLPAMLAFTLLAPDAAIRAHLLFHILLAGVSTYALARAFGSTALAGLLAATIYAHSGFFEGHNVCCYAYSDVAAWLPLLLLGAELAIHSRAWHTRALNWAVAGLALSQILASWIGQGAYYAVLVLASFVAFRCLTSPKNGLGSRWLSGALSSRMASLAVNLTGVLVFGLALAAAGVLPRLEYNLVSNLPGGYPSADISLRATSLTDWGFISGWDRLLLQPGFEYIGWPALILSVAAPLLAWRQPHVQYFALFGAAVLILARAEPTPLHAALSALPGFERIHARSPERALIVLYLAPALLSAASLTSLARVRLWRSYANVLGVVVLAVVVLDLHSAWTTESSESLAGGGDYQFERVDLADYFTPTPAARFLQLKRKDDAPFRYFGYAGHVFGGPMPYTLRWTDPSIAALGVNNRGLLTFLHDIEGYNPVHISRYEDFMVALNGRAQNYHHADVFDTGIDSPLLDVLNVRYIVMPTTLASDEVAPQMRRPVTRVYADELVQIFENPSVLPRAWIVHAAEQVAAEEATQALTSRGLDLRNVAIVEEPTPPLAQPAAASQESVEVVDYEPDHVKLRAIATSPGLLLLSEAYYPAWHAYVDGQPEHIYAVDRALRGVALSAGEHVVEMRYESLALTAGLGITAAAAALFASLAILLFAARSSDGSGEVRCKTGAVPQL
jgi:hypothetical protein